MCCIPDMPSHFDYTPRFISFPCLKKSMSAKIRVRRSGTNWGSCMCAENERQDLGPLPVPSQLFTRFFRLHSCLVFNNVIILSLAC